jgi:hypothetical protein
MQTDIRLSGPTLKVLKLLIEKPLEGRSGADISKSLNISSGTLYPLLARLETAVCQFLIEQIADWKQLLQVNFAVFSIPISGGQKGLDGPHKKKLTVRAPYRKR